MEERKRKHHFVFQAYMRAWNDETIEKIWICRNHELVYPSSTGNVGYSNDFYELPHLSNEEITLLKVFWKNHNDKTTQEQFDRSISNSQIFYCLGKYFHTIFEDDADKIDELMSVGNSNAFEDLLGLFETNLSIYLEKLRVFDSSFYYQPVKTKEGNTRQEFMMAVVMQYFRTKALRNDISKNEYSFKAFKKIANLLNLDWKNISMDNLAKMILYEAAVKTFTYLGSNDTHLTILQNMSEVPFITGDQPVINTEAKYHQSDNSPTKLILYYPISPTIAITLNDDNKEKVLNISKHQVQELNSHIVQASSDFIIGNSKESVEAYCIKNAEDND